MTNGRARRGDDPKPDEERRLDALIEENRAAEIGLRLVHRELKRATVRYQDRLHGPQRQG